MEPQRHPQVSLIDCILLHALRFLPLFARGLFLPHRGLYRFLSWLPLERWSRSLICRLRAKYGSDHLYIRLLRVKPRMTPALGRTLLIYDEASIRTVLADPDLFLADPLVKQERVGLFQPGALVMSSGADARPKWDFNHQVLDTAQKTHHHAAAFLPLVKEEVRKVLARDGRQLVWDQFAQLSERITLQVVLGQGSPDTQLYRQLEEMIKTASCVFSARQSPEFEPFYERLRTHLNRAAGASLVAGWSKRFPDQQEPPWAIYQITHWLFAMKDSLETHAARTLALISSHPEIEKEVRQEIQRALGDDGSLDSDAVSSLHLLEGCVNEAIRLWTPIPLIVRRVAKPCELGGETLSEGCDVVIDGGYNHRDPRRYGVNADQFAPRNWVGGTPLPPMDHFSNGDRQCAGKNLGLFLIKAIVAELLLVGRFRLERPRLNPDVPLPLSFDHYAVNFLQAI